jgi:hypothetical protein
VEQARPKISAIAGHCEGQQGRCFDMTRIFFLLALTGLVAACATSPEQQVANDEQRCTARGYKPLTKEHDGCVTGLAASRDVRLQRRHRELVERPAVTYGPGPR